LSEPDTGPRAVIISTGSEIGLAVEAQKALALEGIPVRVVSMVATSVFDRQPQDYRDSVLPPDLPCVAVEAGSPDLWRKYIDRTGVVIGMTTFGESAPAGELFKHFGFTASHVVEAVRSVVSRAG
jgi:transketolase